MPQAALRASTAVFLVGLVCFAAPCRAQQRFETVGERALGMAGAFVAVADDPTAAHWNPAGLVQGGPAAMTIGWRRSQSGNQKAFPYPGPDQQADGFTALGTWPVGVSYGRFRTTSLVGGPADQLRVESFETTEYNVTLLQSLLDGLVVGTTLKYVRGSVTSGPVTGSTVDAALEAGAELSASARNAFDLDMGLMYDAGKVRVGFTWKNLMEPKFGEIPTNDTTLQRQPRIGLAVLPTTGLTFALDLDLDTVDLRGGLRRMIAVGGETHLGGRVSARSGIRWNLEAVGHQPVVAVGLSVRMHGSFWLDGHWAQGRAVEDREYGVAMRAGF
jgi:hypothetical protein